MDGWIRLHRKLVDSQIFANEKAVKIWIWLLIKARHEKGFVPLKTGRGNSIIELKRGQLLFGRFTAEESLSIDGSTIYKWIQKFKDWEMIELKSNTHSTIITICNYDTYNSHKDNKVTSKEQASNKQVTSKEQASNTNNKDNNEKNDNNEKKNIYIKFINLFNQIKQSKFKGTDKFKGQLNARIREGFTFDDFKKAIENCKNDEYHIKNPNYLTPEFITRPDKFQKYLNYKKPDLFRTTKLG